MGVLRNMADGLANVVANLGTPRDKAASTRYVDEVLPADELLRIYRNSWLARAIVDYPAEDATRKWRKWRAEAEQITAIEAVEKRLKLQRAVKDALVAARLYGGAAIYINTPDADQALPIRPGVEVRSLIVLTPQSLRAEAVVRDISSPYFGRAEIYTLTTGENAEQVRIHASRLAIFRGASVPADSSLAVTQASNVWGDSVLQSSLDAVRQMDSTMANIASLVFEAKVDVFKFQGFAQLLAEAGGDDVLIRRLMTQAAMKGINGAVVIDTEDDYQQKSASFAGLPDVVAKFQDNVSGAAKIPVTRLYGRAAVGLSGSGDGDERVYYDRIGHEQATEVGPALETIDDCILYQALGSRPPEIYYEWTPLRQMTEKERADIFVQTANAARSIAGSTPGTELVPLNALSDALVNELVEQGVLPGLEQKVEEYGTLAEQNEFEPAEPETAIVPAAPGQIGDATPRPLYVSRKVLNATEILAHYEAQGISSLVEPSDMHVTITYSRQPVDWMRMGESWAGELTIPAGGARLMEVFGESRDTLVLAFAASELVWRHEGMKEAGASWDWPDYQPHISVSYSFDGDADGIEPWRGEIRLGPEIFEDINEDWGSK